ncbi:MAG: GNAT family N-acetyltransferase [Clostridia bacterium]|nr:GNAT family N-acetyltransferase [Clostridia bacterium]
MEDSERLTYRLMDSDDFEFYYLLNSDRQVMKYAYVQAYETETQAKQGFDKVISEQSDSSLGKQYIVSIKGTMEQIGIVDYVVKENNSFSKTCEIGYFILPEYWGRGYAAEMGSVLVNYLFSDGVAQKLTASCHEDNKASEKIMIKLGMKKSGVNERARLKGGKYSDEICYSLTADEWMKEC